MEASIKNETVRNFIERFDGDFALSVPNIPKEMQPVKYHYVEGNGFIGYDPGRAKRYL